MRKKSHKYGDMGLFLVTYNEGKDLYDAYELFDFYVVLCYKRNHYFLAEVITSVHPDELPHVWKVGKLN